MNLKMSIFAVAMAAYAVPALAHHSFAMFDKDKTVKISGTLKEFEWTNPHAWLHVVTNEGGKQVEWSFEMGSVGQVAAQGWKADIVKPGDKITIEGHPLKDGSRGGQYRIATLADGRTLGQAAAPAANPNNLPK
jgi:hypothetical protein